MAKKKILLVEDEKDMAYAIEMQFSGSGYEVISALGGREGLNKARKEKPDLIVLDLMLPELDGYKICRMLKFDSKYKHIPIILFSSRAQEEDVRMGMEAGADLYLAKSHDPEILLKKVKEFLKD